MHELNTLRDIHKQLRARLDERKAVVAKRSADYRSGLDQCAEEDRVIESERQALADAERIYEREFAGGLTHPLFEEMPSSVAADQDAPGIVEFPKPLKARIGPQRYRMLYVLRDTNRAMPPEEIAVIAGLGVHRVRTQMQTDHALHVVTSEATELWPVCYSLTRLGADLLARFEAYKRSRGELLPPMSGPLWEDEGEEHHPEETIVEDAAE